MKWLICLGCALLLFTGCSAHKATQEEMRAHFATKAAETECRKALPKPTTDVQHAIAALDKALNGDPCKSGSDLFVAQEKEVAQKNALAGKAVDQGTGLLRASFTPVALAYSAGKYFDSQTDRKKLDDLEEENEELEEKVEELEEEAEDPETNGDCEWNKETQEWEC